MGKSAASSLEVLNTLSKSSLEMLLINCGLPRVGRKECLVQRVLTACRNYRPLRKDSRVLSIDMGLKNLAIVLLTPCPRVGRDRNTVVKDWDSGAISGNFPKLHVWRRLSLLPDECSLAEMRPMAGQRSRKQGFDLGPDSISEMALKLVKEELVPLRPTHILLERQRYRTSGMPNVFEWTLRVNTLEAMLYAIFKTLKGVGEWEGEIMGINPRGVSTYFGVGSIASRRPGEDVGQAEDRLYEDKLPTGMVSERGRAPWKLKKQKINLLGHLLLDGSAVRLADGEVQTVADVFMNSLEPLMARRRKNTVTDKKLDDLSDCLLQGLAWLQWQDNVRLVREGSLDVVTSRDRQKGT